MSAAIKYESFNERVDPTEEVFFQYSKELGRFYGVDGETAKQMAVELFELFDLLKETSIEDAELQY